MVYWEALPSLPFRGGEADDDNVKNSISYRDSSFFVSPHFSRFIIRFLEYQSILTTGLICYRKYKHWNSIAPLWDFVEKLNLDKIDRRIKPNQTLNPDRRVTFQRVQSLGESLPVSCSAFPQYMNRGWALREAPDAGSASLNWGTNLFWWYLCKSVLFLVLLSFYQWDVLLVCCDDLVEMTPVVYKYQFC